MSARVVIVGAGYAGVSAAKRLTRGNSKERPDVTIVNPRADFVERIRLHQHLAGNYTATRPLTSLLPRSTTFVPGSAETIDVDQHTLRLRDGSAIDFDYLIYAVGSASGRDAVPGAAEHAVTIGTIDDAALARERLDALPAGSTLTVIGGGLTGVELAAELSELGTHSVRLVTSSELAPSVGDGGRRYLRRQLTAMGVEVIERSPVAEVKAAKVVLADGRVLSSDLSLLTATFGLPTLAADSGLDVAPNGALHVDETLVSTSESTVVGAGDASRIELAPIRMSCQAAVPLGAHAAETVLHLIAGTEPKPVRPKFVGQCISLGRKAGMMQRTTSDDVPTSLRITGKPGALVKEQICTSTVKYGLNPDRAWMSYSWS